MRPRARRLRLPCPPAVASRPREDLLDRVERPSRLDPARERHDEARSSVSGGVVRVEVASRDRADGARGAEDRRPEGMRLPERPHEDLVDEIVGIVVGLADLLEDDAALGLDVGGVERRREHDVADEIEGLVEVFVERVDVVPRVLLGREGVDLAAEAVDHTRDLRVGPPPRAFEEKMLEEVGQALPRRRLVPGARPDEDAEGEGAHVPHLVDEDGRATVENVRADHRGGLPEGSRHSTCGPAAYLRGVGMKTGGLLAGSPITSLSASPATKRHSS